MTEYGESTVLHSGRRAMNKHKFAVLRRPCLPEDEGRSFLMKVFVSREEAEAWRQAQTDYFKPGDFYILEEGDGQA